MRRKFVVLVVPLLMLAAAIGHWVRVETQDQSPWLGGAFSMFATVDGPYRVVEVVTVEETVRVPASSNNDLRRAATLPSPRELRRLHSTLRDQGFDPLRIGVLRPTFSRGYLDWKEAASYEP